MPKKIKNIEKVVLWRVYQPNYLNKWRLENQEVEKTDKMFYFSNIEKFSDYCRQMPHDRANKMFGTSPQEAFKIATTMVQGKIDAARRNLAEQESDLSEIVLLMESFN